MENETEMTDAERLIKLETRQEQQEKALCQLTSDTREIKEKLLGRPSWTVTIILSSLLTICSGLIIYVTTHGN